VTTIAYRNGVMAGDSLVTSDDTRFGRVRKVFRLANGALVGVSGDAAKAMRLARALEEAQGRLTDDIAALTRKCDGIYVYPQGTVWVLECGGMFECHNDFVASGTGMTAALAAMTMGAGARKAVEVACALDVNSGLPVDVVRL
jgi:ATP-dependent protease HslVU (ClpYQ) peptidase subunit